MSAQRYAEKIREERREARRIQREAEAEKAREARRAQENKEYKLLVRLEEYLKSRATREEQRFAFATAEQRTSYGEVDVDPELVQEIQETLVDPDDLDERNEFFGRLEDRLKNEENEEYAQHEGFREVFEAETGFEVELTKNLNCEHGPYAGCGCEYATRLSYPVIVLRNPYFHDETDEEET